VSKPILVGPSEHVGLLARQPQPEIAADGSLTLRFGQNVFAGSGSISMNADLYLYDSAGKQLARGRRAPSPTTRSVWTVLTPATQVALGQRATDRRASRFAMFGSGVP
jgi:hypothetical protein